MQKQLTGQMIHEAFHLPYPEEAWEDREVETKFEYERVAHALNIKLGHMPVTQTEYLFVYDTEVTQAADLDGLLMLTDVHVEIGETFQIIALRGGERVRHDFYKMTEGRELIFYDRWIFTRNNDELDAFARLFNEKHAKRERPSPKQGQPMTNPKVITICGSMRFYQEMLRRAAILTLEGAIVLMPFVTDATGGAKGTLDDLHKRKIDMSQEIVVVNPDSYIGESAQAEIAYAEARGLTVTYIYTGRGRP